MTKLLEQNWILEQWKEQKGWHSFFCCFHVEVVVLSLPLLEKANYLKKQRLVLAGLSDATVLNGQLRPGKTFLWL